MFPQSTYNAAKEIASIIETHYSEHISEARQSGKQDLAPEPSKDTIEAIIDAGFWASLRREEGNPPKLSLAYLPPTMAGNPMTFEHRFPLSPTVLTKLAPGIERAGIHVGVWHEGQELYIWGTTRILPSLCFVLEVVEPGLLVIKHKRIHGFGKFVNVAVLKGDRIKIVDQNRATLADSPDVLTSLLGFTSPVSWNDSVKVLIQLATSMRAHGHGGSLLVVPSGSDSWRHSIVHPISYPVVPPYTALADILNQNNSERTQRWQVHLSQAVDSVAGLTAIDGATIITDKHELLAFGAKIKQSQYGTPVEKILITEPIIGSEGSVIHPSQNGGTRHFSAAQFVFDQRNAMALIASQDGRFTIFAWSDQEDMVLAHRVDSLLL
ncbi:MAG TPA: hypothetical protein VGD22_19470 [Sphingobacteriaceae bacterium]